MALRGLRAVFPAALPRHFAVPAVERSIPGDDFRQHLDGINRSRLERREGIGAATVERYFREGLKRHFSEWHSRQCPRVLRIGEHFFTRKKAFATTLCDLHRHRVYDVVLGRSELSLEAYFQKLEGKAEVRVVCMDLASSYRCLVRLHVPNARVVADRFHVIRIINHHFLACWRDIDPVASKNRGLLSLMRRHRHNLSPDQLLRLTAYLEKYLALELIYRFKQRLCLSAVEEISHPTAMRSFDPAVPAGPAPVAPHRLAQLVQLGQTLTSWSQEIVALWRFTRNNGITEGFHNKMELINRQTYGFRNFENYRLRVKVLCG